MKYHSQQKKKKKNPLSMDMGIDPTWHKIWDMSILKKLGHMVGIPQLFFKTSR